METLRIVGLVVGGVILLGALATMGVWVPKVLYRSPEPGKLDGLTVKFTDARVSEDRVIDRTWACRCTCRTRAAARGRSRAWPTAPRSGRTGGRA